jgi:predicted dehydrogenase
MLKIGVIGAGHLGKIHLKILKENPFFDLIGFYDSDLEKSKLISSELGIKMFSDMDAVIQQAEVIDIVTPTVAHYDCAIKAMKQSRHVFIEKPLSNSIEEAREMIALAQEANVKVQVGHVERFNPAFTAAKPYIDQPMFIETHRLAEFNPRGTDVSVVLDLMIHDIDIVLHMVKSEVKKINCSGVAVVSDTPDICNARIEFDNGCVANLTASRISLKNMRKSRFFQRDAYIAVDFLKKKTEIVRLKTLTDEPDPLAVIIDLGKEKGSKQIYFENPKVRENNAIRDEMESFASAIINNTQPIVSIQDGFGAMQLAHQIIEKLRISLSMLA